MDGSQQISIIFADAATILTWLTAAICISELYIWNFVDCQEDTQQLILKAGSNSSYSKFSYKQIQHLISAAVVNKTLPVQL